MPGKERQAAGEKVVVLYRRVFARNPTPREQDLAQSFLAKAREQLGRDAWPEYAQALLGANEFIFLQ